MKELLINYLEEELVKHRVALNEWMKGPIGHVSQEMCDEKCDHFSKLIDFHNEALKWLKELP